ncbi:MAG: methylated-DNA--[protein]-cysteine S-methyltransferase [Desulfobacca sp.]|nr:methylated-DNA--[protein]-cysteine S-methyltransferase [Desulfobacca sp.]
MANTAARTFQAEAEEYLLETPLGRIGLVFSPQGLRQLLIYPDTDNISTGGPEPAPIWKTEVVQALRDYFAGRAHNFDQLKLDLQGTPFQLRVWAALRLIPFGATVSYGELACHLGLPKAARAVGGALRANPLPIIIPCHRVISADGSLGGFSAGLQVKRWLLEHEQVIGEAAI